MSVMGVLTLIFVVLKLVGVIAWSWWLVLAPLWVGLGLYIVIVGFMALFTGKQLSKIRKELKK